MGVSVIIDTIRGDRPLDRSTDVVHAGALPVSNPFTKWDFGVVSPRGANLAYNG